VLRTRILSDVFVSQLGAWCLFFYLKNPQLTSVHEQIRLIETRLDIFVPAVIALKNTKKRFTDIIPLWIDLIQLTARIKLDRFRIILESIHTKCSFIYQDIQRIDDLLRDIRFYSIHLYRKSMIARKVNTIPIPIRSKLSLIHPRIASLLRDTENAKGRL